VPNIIGLGIDATDIPRITATIARYGDRFIRRIFTETEIAYCNRRREPAIHFAGRFAAKEAAMKALGLGWRGLAFRDIEVGRDARGKPLLAFHGAARRRAEALRVRAAEVSITHGRDIAAAVVVLLTEA
jgi:holo-[acyl-carrier protein] synthase